MQILWWLAPPVVATAVAMLWVAWLGREGRGEVDRDVAVRRLGEAMARPAPDRRTTSGGDTARTRASAPDDRSTGVAVRRSSRAARPGSGPASAPSAHRSSGGPSGSTRRAS